MTEESKTYSLVEVAKHNVKQDCWLIIHGAVYNVTPFLDEHPGGEEVLIEQAGKDATEAFEDVGHSTDARDRLVAYKIGELCGEDKAKTKKVEEKKLTWSNQTENDTSGWQTWVGAIVLALVPIALYRMGYFGSK